jgi:hypothetical protein
MRIAIEKMIMVAQLDIHDIPAQAFGVDHAGGVSREAG